MNGQAVKTAAKHPRLAAAALGTLLGLGACGGAKAQSAVPLSEAPRPEPEVTIIWLGHGESNIVVDGYWQRQPEFDYEFDVVQRRYEGQWQSIKHLHRRHPDYDGSAGPRDIVYHFTLAYTDNIDGSVNFDIDSTLGTGNGKTDVEFRAATLELQADVSKMAPFNTYRITQDYQYENGRLLETVELFDRQGGEEKPWVTVHEVATMFSPHAFATPPTTASN